MFLTAALFAVSSLAWGPDLRFDTAYALELDRQFDSARILYRQAVTSPTDPIEAHLGLLRVAEDDPTESVPVYPPDSAHPRGHLLHLYSRRLAFQEDPADTWWVLPDSDIRAQIRQDSSLIHAWVILLAISSKNNDAFERLVESRDSFIGHPLFDHALLSAAMSRNIDTGWLARLMKVYESRPMWGLFHSYWCHAHRNAPDHDTLLRAAAATGDRMRDDALFRMAIKAMPKDTPQAKAHLEEILSQGWNNSTYGAVLALAGVHRRLGDETAALRVMEDYERRYGARYVSMGSELAEAAEKAGCPDTHVAAYWRMALDHHKGTRRAAFSDGKLHIRHQLALALIKSGRPGEALEQVDQARGEASGRIEKLMVFALQCHAYIVWQPAVLTAWILTYTLAVLVFPITLIYFVRLPGTTSGSKLAAATVTTAILCLQTAATPDFGADFWTWSAFSAARNFLLVATSLTILASEGIRHRFGWKGLVEAGAVVLIGGAWSYALYGIERPEMSPILKTVMDLPSEFGIPLGPGWPAEKTLSFVVSAAFTEELLCRLLPVAIAVRSFGGRPAAQGAALALATLAWAAAHAGMVTPEWWKFVQVTGLGALLSVLFLRRGFVACMAAHGIFNAIAVFVP
ncbi:MAG: hypothetical protein A3G34_13550 [Candidatus Lindowbacteria bacterium RIFCSPLOWO2_12_FULL_62_27]|nr:MAG: hypothetical protein A3G34_13550 [Candidatus Lindowbacteria bacterium RIFCSPLOWO2_12_FULL_62_27]